MWFTCYNNELAGTSGPSQAPCSKYLVQCDRLNVVASIVVNVSSDVKCCYELLNDVQNCCGQWLINSYVQNCCV
jgi:hypothetical protein